MLGGGVLTRNTWCVHPAHNSLWRNSVGRAGGGDQVYSLCAAKSIVKQPPALNYLIGIAS